ncbi:sorting nexin-11 isoform X1 [Danio rerio]|uniref:Sorting nexin-11 isoform X1 n=1 Tax=Danio rerio TaxID=7955 RepID=A0A8M9PW72_DANRE|nr:sorting nexin-11 isoform X1 [Danio rerio]|eukprot:XP_021335737.1 sorting nexin-11 isoform X1 [Danio rerio]
MHYHSGKKRESGDFCILDTLNKHSVMYWRADSKRNEESVDFPHYGIVKILAFFKLWKTKDKIICPLCCVSSGRMSKSQEQDEFIAVRVQDPRVQNEGSWNSYVDFKIFLHTNSKAFTAKTSCVRRRYSEFAWLKKKLQKNAGLVPVPELPKKSIFSFINDDFIERRRKGLQGFLDKVLHMTVCLSDSQLHLFLQTQLPVKHIEDCVHGHTPYTVTEAILSYASSNRGWVQEEGGADQELCSTTVSYESVESPVPHLPSLQSPGALSSGPPNELTDASELRLSDTEQTALKTDHEHLPEEKQSYIKLVVEVHPNLQGSVETEEDSTTTESEDAEILVKDTKYPQTYNCESPAPQIDGSLEDKPLQREKPSKNNLDQEPSFGEDLVDNTSVDKVIERGTLDNVNDAMKGNQEDSTVGQTSDENIHEEDPRVRIQNNEVTLDLSAIQEDKAENVPETAVTTMEDVALQVELTENHTIHENGISDEDYSAIQEEAVTEKEDHVGEVNKLNAKCLQASSGILILEGIEEAVSTQTAPVTETASNLDANTAEVNTLVLKAIEMDAVQCQETDSQVIIATQQLDAK